MSHELQSVGLPNIGQILPRANTTLARPAAPLFMVIFGLILLGTLLNVSGLDLQLSRVFSDGLAGFPLRGHWLSERLLHYYGGKLTIFMALVIIAYNIKQYFMPSECGKRIVAGRYVLLSCLASFSIIGLLKQFTTLPCPWNLIEFGGFSEYITIFNAFSKNYAVGHCFPAGHATGAYGLLCLGFVMLAFNKPMKMALIPIFVLGAFYSGAQLVRGAHFISHDLFSIAISLSMAWIMNELYLTPAIKRLSERRIASNTILIPEA